MRQYLVTFALLSALLLLPDKAKAQCLSGSPSCDAAAIEAWLLLGPTLSPLVNLQNQNGSLEAAPYLRFGFLAGLPVQPEITLRLGSFDMENPSEPFNVSLGVRVLPVAFTDTGTELGGQPGHNPGFIVGYDFERWHAGLVYEYLFVPYAGVIVEALWNFTFPMKPEPSLNIGAKFQFPVFSFL